MIQVVLLQLHVHVANDILLNAVPEEFKVSPPRAGTTLASIKKVSGYSTIDLYYCCIIIIFQLFHEEIALQWIFAHGNNTTKNMVLKNSWFFFEIIVRRWAFIMNLFDPAVPIQIKSMAQYLNRTNKLQSSRKEHFTVKFMEDLETLIGAVAVEICQRHIKVIKFEVTISQYDIIH